MAKECEMNDRKELLRNGYGGQAKVTRVNRMKFFDLNLIGIISVICLFSFDSMALTEDTHDYRSCLACHEGIERMDENHDFPCLQCHLLPADRDQVLGEHAQVLRHPAAPEHVETLCGECHQKEISILRDSLHYTLAGLIGQTRYLWGGPGEPPARVFSI